MLLLRPAGRRNFPSPAWAATATSAREDAYGKTQYQWQGARRSGRARHPHSVGDPRTSWADRHEIRLWRRPVRRVLGTHQWRRAALLLHASRRREGDRSDRYHRGPVAGTLASGAEGLGGARRTAVRLLPVGPAH